MEEHTLPKGYRYRVLTENGWSTVDDDETETFVQVEVVQTGFFRRLFGTEKPVAMSSFTTSWSVSDEATEELLKKAYDDVNSQL